MKKTLKWIAIVVGGYVGLVVLFESLIGFVQPQQQGTVVITTMAPDGSSHERVLSLLEADDKLYVAANHWPRAWYRNARENPEVQLKRGGETRDYRAVPVTGAEHERLGERFEPGFVIRFLTGFPPRKFLRLEPAHGA